MRNHRRERAIKNQQRMLLLPDQLQRKLKVSIIERRSGNGAHVAGGNICRRITEVGVIDDVECLCTKLSGKPFCDGKVLKGGEVELSGAETAEDIACHRSLIADAVLARGGSVEDVFVLADGRSSCKPHKLTSFAQVSEGRLFYPPQQNSLDM